MPLRIRIVELGALVYKRGRKVNKHPRPGHCKACGAKLSDELSIKRGYGRECYEKYTAIVLDIIPDGAK
jgi:hypothetical protein